MMWSGLCRRVMLHPGPSSRTGCCRILTPGTTAVPRERSSLCVCSIDSTQTKTTSRPSKYTRMHSSREYCCRCCLLVLYSYARTADSLLRRLSLITVNGDWAGSRLAQAIPYCFGDSSQYTARLSVQYTDAWVETSARFHFSGDFRFAPLHITIRGEVLHIQA